MQPLQARGIRAAHIEFQSPEGEVLTVQRRNMAVKKTARKKFQSPEGEVLTVQRNSKLFAPQGCERFQSPEGVVLTVQRLPLTHGPLLTHVSVPRRGSADGATETRNLPVVVVG